MSGTERGAQGLDAWRLRRLAGGLGVAPVWLLGLAPLPLPAGGRKGSGCIGADLTTVIDQILATDG